MKVLLDTSALNWLTDHREEAYHFFEARDRGEIDVLVPLEVATEVRKTNDPERRAALERVLSRFLPITPTRVPRLGAFRLAMGRWPSENDLARLKALKLLRDGQDRDIAANAGGYRCDVFMTCDTEMSRTKRPQLETILGGTRVLEPESFLEEILHRP